MTQHAAGGWAHRETNARRRRTTLHVAGAMFMLVGLLGGAYLGIWWALAGGVMGLVDLAQAQEPAGAAIVANIARIALWGIIGAAPIVTGVASGVYLWDRAEAPYRHGYAGNGP